MKHKCDKCGRFISKNAKTVREDVSGSDIDLTPMIIVWHLDCYPKREVLDNE